MASLRRTSAYLSANAVLRLADMAPMLVRLSNAPAAAPKEGAMGDTSDLEARISELDREALDLAGTLGMPAPFSCPDCCILDQCAQRILSVFANWRLE